MWEHRVAKHIAAMPSPDTLLLFAATALALPAGKITERLRTKHLLRVAGTAYLGLAGSLAI
jgi:hypothetical protein